MILINIFSNGMGGFALLYNFLIIGTQVFGNYQSPNTVSWDDICQHFISKKAASHYQPRDPDSSNRLRISVAFSYDPFSNFAFISTSP